MKVFTSVHFKNTIGIMGALCILLTPLAAKAEEGGEVNEPQYDVVTPATLPAPDAEHFLRGAVTKKQSLKDISTEENQIADQTKTLQTEITSNDIYQRALKKLSQRIKLSSEEYRSLGVGVAGCDIYQPFFQRLGHVERVYIDSPADRAGVKVGDEVVLERDPKTEAMAKANPLQPLYQATFAREGTTAEITFLRHNRPVKVKLIRMNIEDIKEDKYRHMWEELISNLGNPQEGKFTGTSLNNLERN